MVPTKGQLISKQFFMASHYVLQETNEKFYIFLP